MLLTLYRDVILIPKGSSEQYIRMETLGLGRHIPRYAKHVAYFNGLNRSPTLIFSN